jgi:Tfp pilus assembly protein PilN
MRAARKARKASIAVAFLTLLTILDAAAYDVATRGGAAHDQAAVAAAQVNRSALQQRADKLAPLDPFLAQVGQAQAMVSAASSGKIIWSSVLAQLLTVLPAGSSITSVTLTSSEGGQAGSSTTVYGTVALTGTTGTVREVAGILRALAGAPTLTDVYLTSTAAQNATSTAGITWTVSADITSKALATTIAAATP